MIRKRSNIVMLASSTHKPFDTRIFHREGKSLTSAGFKVTLIIPHTESILKDGIQIVAVPLSKNGWEQLIKNPIKIFFKALKQPNHQSIFQLHDSELLFVGLLLKMCGRKVIYDAHEDTPLQISYQHWIPRWLKKPYASYYWVLEKLAGWLFDAIVIAEPIIGRYFPKKKTFLVRNFPSLRMFGDIKVTPYEQRSVAVLYVGLLSKVRGALEIAESARLVHEKQRLRYLLAGKFAPSSLEMEVRERYGEYLEIRSWVEYHQYLELLADSKIGITVPHPIERYKTNYPTKLFEYMAAGLPVISSAFGESTQFVKEADCGVLVNPLKPDEIKDAILWLLQNSEMAQAMGARGRQLIFQKYNWENEAKILVEAIEFVSI